VGTAALGCPAEQSSAGKWRSFSGIRLGRATAIAVQRCVYLLLHEFRVQRNSQELGKFPADFFGVLERLVICNSNRFHLRLPVEPGIDLTQVLLKGGGHHGGIRALFVGSTAPQHLIL